MIEVVNLDYFRINETDDRGCAFGCEFSAIFNGRRYTAYGAYESLNVYSVDHGPTQADVDVISALLDEGFEPDAGSQI